MKLLPRARLEVRQCRVPGRTAWASRVEWLQAGDEVQGRWQTCSPLRWSVVFLTPRQKEPVLPAPHGHGGVPCWQPEGRRAWMHQDLPELWPGMHEHWLCVRLPLPPRHGENPDFVVFFFPMKDQQKWGDCSRKVPKPFCAKILEWTTCV